MLSIELTDRRELLVMPTLLLPPRYSSDSRDLRQAAEKLGWNTFRFSSWNPSQRSFPGKIALYGEPLFIDVIASLLDIVVLDHPITWLPSLPENLVKRKITLMTLDEVRLLTLPQFIKPAEHKDFPAGVYTMSVAAPEGSDTLPGSLPVLIADPVHWDIEFRFFILERKIQTYSAYLSQGNVIYEHQGNWDVDGDETKRACLFVEEILANPNVALAPAIVLDVGRIRGRGWAIIETNGAWGSGLYGCNPSLVLPVLLRATRSSLSIHDSDRGYIRPRVEIERD